MSAGDEGPEAAMGRCQTNGKMRKKKKNGTTDL
jgi:hypothetical protein